MFKLIYRTEDGTLGEGYIAKEAVSKLTGRDRIRIVDYLSECDDPEAGKWIDATDVVRRY